MNKVKKANKVLTLIVNEAMINNLNNKHCLVMCEPVLLNLPQRPVHNLLRIPPVTVNATIKQMR